MPRTTVHLTLDGKPHTVEGVLVYVSLWKHSGQGRNRTAAASLFRATLYQQTLAIEIRYPTPHLHLNVGDTGGLPATFWNENEQVFSGFGRSITNVTTVPS